MSKTWFVTGAGSGIGAGIAKAALAAGDRVVATGRNLEKLRKTFGAGEGDNLAFVQLDVANQAQAEVAVAQAVDQFGRIDVAVNNAGYSLLGHFEEMTNDEIGQLMNTNFYGVVNVMRAVLPVMRRQGAGHIINVSSTAGVVGFAHCAAYSSSKFAVEGLSASVAPEVERFGVKLTVIEPGFFRTDLLDERNVRYPANAIADYAGDESVKDTWAAYNGTQQGDPLKLGEVVVKIAGMANPPRQFAAGSDAVAMIRPALEARLNELREHLALSNSTDGNPGPSPASRRSL